MNLGEFSANLHSPSIIVFLLLLHVHSSVHLPTELKGKFPGNVALHVEEVQVVYEVFIRKISEI